MKNPREELESLVEQGKLEELLIRAAILHGHYCPMLSLGVIAGVYAMRELRAENTGMEEVIAIVETNNCFSDGIQFVTGCTFGNNALIYRDVGKTAVTVVKRSADAIRMAVKPETFEILNRNPENRELFRMVIEERGGTEDDKKRLMKWLREVAFDLLKKDPEELFTIRKVQEKVPEFAPIHESVICETCGEGVIVTRIVEKEGKKLCIPCAGAQYYEISGKGVRQLKQYKNNEASSKRHS